MSPSRRASLAPWIVAAVAGVVLIALLITYFTVLRPYKKDHTPGQFTSAEKAAMAAASTETANLLTFRRSHFDADYARAVNGTTGSLRSDVAAKKSATKSTLVTGKFDLSARITHEALVGPAAKNGYIVLVTVNGYKSTTPTVPTQQNLQVTVQKVKGNWLASDVENVGVS